MIDPDLCTSLVDDFNNKREYWSRAHNARGYSSLSQTHMDPSLVQEYEHALGQVITNYTNYFPFSKEAIAAWTLETPYNFQHYEPSKSYSTWHCENNGEPRYSRRHLAFMTYLNSVEIGGETHFIHQNLKIKPEIGLTLVWPAYFTHTHRGIPAKTEEKYVTTGWFKFFDTENFMEKAENLSDEDFYRFADETLSKVT